MDLSESFFDRFLHCCGFNYFELKYFSISSLQLKMEAGKRNTKWKNTKKIKMENDQNNHNGRRPKKSKWKMTKKITLEDDQKNQNGR